MPHKFSVNFLDSCIRIGGLALLLGCSSASAVPAGATFATARYVVESEKQAEPPAQQAEPPVQIDPRAPRQAPEAREAQDPRAPRQATDPRDAALRPEDVRFGAVRVFLRKHQYADAHMVAESILKTTPDSARARFYAGLSLHKQKMYVRARPLLEYASAHQAEFAEGPHAIHFTAWCAYYLGDLPAARAAFEQHLKEFPTYDDSHFGLGLVALDEDQLEQAEACFRTALKLIAQQNGQPRERGKNLARLGDVQLRQGKLAEAEASYREAVALWRDHHEAWAKLARILDRTDRAEEAALARAEQQAAMARLTNEGIPWRP